MAMQDKDFDKLFQQKFDDFEVEPSPMAWDNIESELEGKKTTRSTIPWISIAAAVLVIATAGILFLKADTQTGQHSKNNKLVANRIKPLDPVKQEVKEVKQADPVVGAVPAMAKTSLPVRHRQNNVASASNSIIPVDVTPGDIVEHDPLNIEKSTIANVSGPASTKPAAIIPDVPLSPKTLDAVAQIPDDQASLASAEKQQAEPPVKRRGIHSFGGLINAVVAKLDKRDDKLIEFSDGDDDDDNATKLTGVNLGLIKIKKQ